MKDKSVHTSLLGAIFKAKRSSNAFSLVEVVLALGVMSFALMGIVGLLPVGLSNFRKAIDLTVQSQISQKLTYMIQRTAYVEFDNLGDINTPSTYHFDEEGTPVEPERSVYLASAYVISDTNLNGLLCPTWAPNEMGKALNNVKAVQITITNRAFPANSQTITTYVANAGF